MRPERIIGLLLLMGLAQCPAAREATDREIISTDGAPKAIGPYSQAVQVGRTIYLAGQIAINPISGKMSEGDIEEQTHRVLQNIRAVLESSGHSMDDVVQSQVYLTDLDNYQAMNSIYASYFKQAPPARAVVEVKRLPRDALIEIMVTAVASE